MAEAIRLVVWDLDETFWHGTVTEGGMAWRDDAEQAVRTLAARGIVSAICSKNDSAHVERILRGRGVWDFFVFSSISWEAKGPRLAALIEAVQLRPESVLFIDDNPANLAEAVHFVPGLQVADETIVGFLLDNPRLQGKPDPELVRLAQYKVLERRWRDKRLIGGDTAAFLRASHIAVRIDHDIEAHLDRAVELINRTNQLNFTKWRLPENLAAARDTLRVMLGRHDIQAGLLHVRDDYGDYGFCGLYVLRAHRKMGRELLHYAFSCRILGMGVETWLYRRLQRPTLNVQGSVLTDVQSDTRDIDWISVRAGIARAVEGPGKGGARSLRYVLARGTCDMRAISHYFDMIADCVFEEFDVTRDGKHVLANHSLIAAQAIQGVDAGAAADFAHLGVLPEDFETVLSRNPMPGPAIWLLGFALEARVPLFRHRATGARCPAPIDGMAMKREFAALMRGEEVGKIAPNIAAHLRTHFTFEGIVPDDVFKAALRRIFGRAAPDTRIFVLLGNTRYSGANGYELRLLAVCQQNAVITEVACEFPNVELLSPASFMTDAEIAALTMPQHYERMVYYRIFQHMIERLPPN